MTAFKSVENLLNRIEVNPQRYLGKTSFPISISFLVHWLRFQSRKRNETRRMVMKVILAE